MKKLLAGISLLLLISCTPPPRYEVVLIDPTHVILDTKTGEMRVVDITREGVIMWGSCTVAQLDSVIKHTQKNDLPWVRFDPE